MISYYIMRTDTRILSAALKSLPGSDLQLVSLCAWEELLDFPHKMILKGLDLSRTRINPNETALPAQ